MKLLAVLVVMTFLEAQTPPAPLAVRVYTVTDPAAFPALPGGKVLIHLNGLFQSPGIDYTLTGAGAFVFKPGFLSVGDQIEVVTLP